MPETDSSIILGKSLSLWAREMYKA